jgi:hypothetical protein
LIRSAYYAAPIEQSKTSRRPYCPKNGVEPLDQADEQAGVTVTEAEEIQAIELKLGDGEAQSGRRNG